LGKGADQPAVALYWSVVGAVVVAGISGLLEADICVCFWKGSA
jgi:hypothetical protein